MTESINNNTSLTQQWLAEIQALKRQLAEQRIDLEAAWESAEKWRKFYNTEAEQRRTDTHLFQQTIASLKADIHKLKGIEAATLADGKATAAIQAEITQIQAVEELQTKLIAAIKERDRLLQALKTEQESHVQTRKSLTTALGDAIDSLARERSAAEQEK
ncbi:hypothetical protein IQ259_03965 [Fortiea sp. LEGE XX443]|uniref:hypothetical protein n=1 Tax=Fortiea sp. LEGE XX443 TaxID=1828611 RepID=UPI00187F7A1F|nr:hypothetical protein [Fortiea sp. LEGE XX443]MBE9004205.1 hypothetical protein [Fortiea sp. LEGE XX443]